MISACPCCLGYVSGQLDELCDTCLIGALDGKYPHGCVRDVERIDPDWDEKS